MHLYSSFDAIHVVKVQKHNDLNAKEWGISFKVNLCISMILWVEMGHTIIQNSNKLNTILMYLC
jgi:hypothetical protein